MYRDSRYRIVHTSATGLCTRRRTIKAKIKDKKPLRKYHNSRGAVPFKESYVLNPKHHFRYSNRRCLWQDFRPTRTSKPSVQTQIACTEPHSQMGTAEGRPRRQRRQRRVRRSLPGRHHRARHPKCSCTCDTSPGGTYAAKAARRAQRLCTTW